MLLPVAGTKGPSRTALLPRLSHKASHEHRVKAKPQLGTSPQQWLCQLQPGQGCARGASTLHSKPQEALLPGGLARRQKLQTMLLESAQDISHESDGKGGSGVT